MDYSKHPQKWPIQEFHKTTFTTFGPSVCDKLLHSISPKYVATIYSKHPRKWPIQEFHKTASQSFGPFMRYFSTILKSAA